MQGACNRELAARWATVQLGNGSYVYSETIFESAVGRVHDNRYGSAVVEFLSKHRIFASGDLDEGANFAGKVWERNRSIKTDDRVYGIRWNQLDIEKIGFSYIEHDCAVDLTAQGPLSDHFRVFFHEDGSIGHKVNGKRFESHTQNAVMHAPGADLHLDINPFKLFLLTIDGSALRTALQRRFRKLPAFLDWVGVLPESGSVETVRSLAKWMAFEMERDGSPISVPGKSRRHAEKLLLNLIVECLSTAAPKETEPVQHISLARSYGANTTTQNLIFAPSRPILKGRSFCEVSLVLGFSDVALLLLTALAYRQLDLWLYYWSLWRRS
jgi:hypothetical protein